MNYVYLPPAKGGRGMRKAKKFLSLFLLSVTNSKPIRKDAFIVRIRVRVYIINKQWEDSGV